MSNLDLLSVGITIASISLLAFIIYFNNRSSTTAKAFLAFSVLTVFWSIANYLQYQPTGPATGLLMVRIIAFLGCWHALAFFNLCYVFPQREAAFPKMYWRVLLSMVSAVSLLTLSPFVFEQTNHLSKEGVVLGVTTSIGVIPFMLLVAALIVSGIVLIARKTFSSTGLERLQFIIVGSGMTITFAAIVVFNIIFPIFLGSPRFLPLSAIFMFPFIALTSYAIAYYRLFNVKVVTTAALVFAISIVSLSDIILSKSLISIFIHSVVFGLILFFGINLIKEVQREINFREMLEKQGKDLAVAYEQLHELDQQKSEFLSVASHQLRTPLTAIKWQASMLVDGSYGKMSKEVTEATHSIFDSSSLMAGFINDYLNVSRIEQGRMDYTFTPTKIAPILKTIVKQLTPVAHSKSLTFILGLDDSPALIRADVGKLTQVFSNLIDNSVKYTPAGDIKITLHMLPEKEIARIEIHDNGIGITKEASSRLFEKFVRAENGKLANANGSGLGLFVAKTFIIAHNGKIWAESDGENKGTTFIIELPLLPNTGDTITEKLS